MPFPIPAIFVNSDIFSGPTAHIFLRHTLIHSPYRSLAQAEAVLSFVVWINEPGVSLSPSISHSMTEESHSELRRPMDAGGTYTLVAALNLSLTANMSDW